ncbi:MAG: sulfotransferase family protein, partial [Planctomycetia bacterium]
GHEDPLLVGRLDAVLSVLPDARIVHIVRDPRDVAASILRFPWGANNVFTAAADWSKHTAHAEAVGKRLGPSRYFSFRYEDLLSDPETVFADLQRFVVGKVQPVALAGFVAYMNDNPKARNFGKWLRKLEPAVVRRIEAAAGRQMEQFGYERAYEPRRATFPEYIFWRLHHRAVQAERVFAGRLAWTGAAHITLSPEEHTVGGADDSVPPRPHAALTRSA